MGQRKQPGLTARLNYGHPLALNAHYMFVFNVGVGQKVIDYASGWSHGSFGYYSNELILWQQGALDMNMLGLHPSVRARSDAGQALRLYLGTKSPLLGEQVTFFWQGAWGSPTANGDVFDAVGHAQIKHGDTISWNAGTAQALGTTGNIRTTVGISIDADAGKITVVEGGVVIKNAESFTQGTPASYSTVRMLVDQYGNHYPTFSPSCFYVYNGAKTLDELLWLSFDPYAMFEDGPALAKTFFLGGLPDAPVIEADDCTESGNGTAETPWVVSRPAQADGDLLILMVASDGTYTHDSVENGPNGEVLSPLIWKYGGTLGQIISVWWWIADGAASSGTITVTPAGAEEWTAIVAKVPAGEFDAEIPFGSSSEGYNTAAAATPLTAFSAGPDDGGGRVCFVAAVDTYTLNASAPTGWTHRIVRDRGAVGIGFSTRDSATTDDESISATDFDLSGTDTAVNLAFIVRKPYTGSARSFPTIVGFSGDSTTSGTQTDIDVSIAGTPAEGDLVIVIAGKDGTGAFTWPGTPEFTAISGFPVTAASGDEAAVMDARYRVWQTGDSATFSLTHANEVTAHQIYRITGYSGVPTAASSVATGTSAVIDAASCAPGWGTKDILWIHTALHDGNTGTYVGPRYPKTFSRFSVYAEDVSATYNAILQTSRLLATAASVDAGSSRIAAAEQWAAAVIAVQPAESTATSHWPPVSDVSDGSWTASTGSDLAAMIDEQPDASDTDYILSAASPVDDTCIVTLPAEEPPAGTVKIRIRARFES